MNAKQSPVVSRIETLQDYLGCSQARFSQKCGLSKSNLSKMMNGKLAITNRTLQRIANAYQVNIEWLRNGVGEMFARDKEEAESQYAQTQELFDAVSKRDNADTNSDCSDVQLLHQRIEMLERIIEEKDKQIKDKDVFIKSLNAILDKMVNK